MVGISYHSNIARLLSFGEEPQAKMTIRQFMWAEFVMTFVQSAMQSSIMPDVLSNIPSNIGELWRFLTQEKDVPGMSDTKYLRPLFANKAPEDSIEPTIANNPLLAPEDLSMLNKKRLFERILNARLAKLRASPGS